MTGYGKMKTEYSRLMSNNNNGDDCYKSKKQNNDVHG